MYSNKLPYGVNFTPVNAIPLSQATSVKRLGRISAIEPQSGLATIIDTNDQDINFLIASSPFELFHGQYVWFDIVLTATGLAVSGLMSLTLSRELCDTI